MKTSYFDNTPVFLSCYMYMSDSEIMWSFVWSEVIFAHHLHACLDSVLF